MPIGLINQEITVQDKIEAGAEQIVLVLAEILLNPHQQEIHPLWEVPLRLRFLEPSFGGGGCNAPKFCFPTLCRIILALFDF